MSRETLSDLDVYLLTHLQWNIAIDPLSYLIQYFSIIKFFHICVSAVHLS